MGDISLNVDAGGCHAMPCQGQGQGQRKSTGLRYPIRRERVYDPYPTAKPPQAFPCTWSQHLPRITLVIFIIVFIFIFVVVVVDLPYRSISGLRGGGMKVESYGIDYSTVR